jgi:hypothetical protein
LAIDILDADKQKFVQMNIFMEKAENIKKLDTYEPQVLRKAEITRILNSAFLNT